MRHAVTPAIPPSMYRHFAIMTIVLAYAISNYGTLLRHREMVVITMSLLALPGRRSKAEAENEAPRRSAAEMPAIESLSRA